MKLPPIGNGKSAEQLDLERAAAQKMRDDLERLEEDREAGIETIIDDEEAENYVFGAADFQQQVLSQEKESSVLASSLESVVNGFVKIALDKVVEANVAELEESKRKLSGESAQPKLSQQQIDVLQQVDQDLQIDSEFGAELVAKLESDPAKAKTAFENISGLLKDDTQDSAQKKSAIGAISNETNDSALQIFANMSQEIIGLKAEGKISEEEEKRVIQKLTEQFAFLGDGQKRTAEESVELALVNAEKVSTDGVILGALEKGLIDTLKSIKEKNQPEEYEQDFEEIDPSELEEEEYKDDFEEENEQVTPNPKDKEKLKEQDELEEDPIDEEEPEEQKELKKKKSRALKSTDTKDTEGSETDQKKKRFFSYKDAEEIAKVAAKPALRLGIALALAFAVPGVGVVLAAGFLLATSSKEEEKQNEKKPEDRPLANEADNYLEEREQIRKQIEKSGPDTEVQKVTHGVVLEQQEGLGEMASALKTAGSSLKRVDASVEKTDEEKKKQVVSKAPSKQLDEQTLKDVGDAKISLDVRDVSNIENSSSHANSGAITSTSKSGQPQQII